jgi:hypothetical protein
MTGMAEDEQVLETLRAMADQLHVIEDALAKLAISLTALQGTVAMQMNPEHPDAALKQILALESELEKSDPTAEYRKKTGDLLEAVRLLQKHGAPKRA